MARVTHSISRNPRVCSGRPCITGTRIRVMDIAVLQESGYSPERILEEFPVLSLPQVQAALDYYRDHRDEIQAALDEDERLAAQAERERAQSLSTRRNR
ncbi:MAG: DUF433 domain-containing protein [Vicinamibacteria bacterium]